MSVYQAPKETAVPDASGDGAPDSTAAMPPSTVMPATIAGNGGPQWTAPPGWARLPDEPMRFATFSVAPNEPKLTVVVYSFGPESGSVLPNVNRWAQQIGAPISTENDLPKIVRHMKCNGLEIDYADINAPATTDHPDGTRLLATLIPHGGQVWFTKFAGPAPLIAAHKGEYDGFLKSITFGDPANGVAANISPLPANSNKAPAPEASLIPAFKSYTVPVSWAYDPQVRPMRLATFHLVKDAQQADVIISQLPADQFGSPEANINRWRAQVGLDPVADPALVKRAGIDVDGAAGFVLDFSGPGDGNGAAQRLIVAQVTRGTNAYFFKLFGPTKVVESQEEAFDSFLHTLKFAAE